ncbi:MAG: mitochondrial fission ELM1 family protein [Alphaproteobacteria bacterium]
MTTPTCWVLSDGKPGMETQCVGLAEALGFPFVVKRIRARAPWRFLPPQLWLAPLKALAAESDALKPPWPDLLVATGRNTVALSIALKKASGGRTFTVQIQKPVVSPRRFDLVVPAEHDGCRGPNVVPTRGSLHRVTPEGLKAAAEAVAPRVAHLPRPLVAVLVGGSNKVYRLTEGVARSIGERLAAFAGAEGAGLLVTPSRRTGARNEAVLRRTLAGAPAFIWDGRDDNPYLGFLGLAEAIVVTADSVNMVSEACATGKPVYVIELKGGSEKFRRFHRSLREEGMTRSFDGRLDRWTYPPLDETQRVAREVRARMRLA